jgi:hypothetical protein
MQTPGAPRRQRRATQRNPSLAERMFLLWVAPHTAEVPPQQSLKRRLVKLGFCIETTDFTAVPNQPLLCFEFIVLCVPRSRNEQVAPLLACIRACSHAPVVLLAEAPEHDWSLDMVSAGADAVLDQDTPDSVLLAHCTALLRRWRPDRFRFAHRSGQSGA